MFIYVINFIKPFYICAGLQVLRFRKMSSSSFPVDWSHQNGNSRNPEDTLCSVAEVEEFDFSKALDKPRLLNIERQRSCDERSMSELSIGFSPRQLSTKPDNYYRLPDHLDNSFFLLPKSGLNTPRSLILDPHPLIVSEAWEALRRSLVYFRGQPVGTIAALDNSDEKLNYDQVPCFNHVQSNCFFYVLF